MAAVNFGLDNFTLFLDNNRMQSDGMSADVMNISDRYAGMLKAMGFQVAEIDGNDLEQVYDAFMAPAEAGKPRAIVGYTIKGKGVSFMENNNDWHHNRLTESQLTAALAELEAAD
jgi:transketolase